MILSIRFIFFFNDTATTEIYTLSLHDALPISEVAPDLVQRHEPVEVVEGRVLDALRHHGAGRLLEAQDELVLGRARGDRKSTRLNSSHANISYAVFCLKKKKNLHTHRRLCICI